MVLQLWKVVLWDLAQGGWEMSDFNHTKESLVLEKFINVSVTVQLKGKLIQ